MGGQCTDGGRKCWSNLFQVPVRVDAKRFCPRKGHCGSQCYIHCEIHKEKLGWWIKVDRCKLKVSGSLVRVPMGAGQSILGQLFLYPNRWSAKGLKANIYI